jgi:chorismate-pyruvate lyase
MSIKDEVIAQKVPDALWQFLSETCQFRTDAMTRVAPEDVPEPDQDLLVHQRDMTSTLARFHGIALRVEIIQQRRLGELYLREVFLRTTNTNRIAEYGVIAIALERFSPVQREAVEAGRIPLGGLLHQFEIPFESAPIYFFSVANAKLAQSHRAALNGATSYGRFNRLFKPAGEPLAWIMEILPSLKP